MRQRHPRMPWTQEEYDVAKQMVEAGHDVDSIAIVLKSRTRIAISDFVRRNFGGVQQHWKPEIDHRALKELFNV